MKPVEITDQTCLNLAEQVQICRRAMNYWTRMFLEENERFFNTLIKKYPAIKKADENGERLSYNFEAQMIVSNKEDLPKEGTET